MGGIRKDSVGVAQRRTEPPWPGLVGLSDEHLVDLHNWLWDRDECQADDFFRVRNAVLVEAERRRWPEGWWEDPSVVLEAR